MAFKAARGKKKAQMFKSCESSNNNLDPKMSNYFSDVQQNYRLKNLPYMAFSAQHSIFKFSPTQWNSYTQGVFWLVMGYV